MRKLSRKEIQKVLDILDGLYPDPKTELNFENPFQLLVSTMLSAQTTDDIIEASRILIQEYHGKVPDTFDELVKLPGVGRKTANVVLANAFGKDTIAADTHVFRVANRLGLTAAPTPEKTEEELITAIPAGLRNKAHHWLIFHGRSTCRARRPNCEECQLNLYCKYFTK